MPYLAHALIRHWVLVIQKVRLVFIGVGKEGRGALAPLEFEMFSKKGCFLSFEW